MLGFDEGLITELIFWSIFEAKNLHCSATESRDNFALKLSKSK